MYTPTSYPNSALDKLDIKEHINTNGEIRDPSPSSSSSCSANGNGGRGMATSANRLRDARPRVQGPWGPTCSDRQSQSLARGQKARQVLCLCPMGQTCETCGSPYRGQSISFDEFRTETVCEAGCRPISLSAFPARVPIPALTLPSNFGCRMRATPIEPLVGHLARPSKV